MENVNYELELMHAITKVIYTAAKIHITDDLIERSVNITDTKVDNALRNWYWSVGFKDIVIQGNKITLVVNRPNKFIGSKNFLKSLTKEFEARGYQFELVKSEPDFFYKAFFGE